MSGQGGSYVIEGGKAKLVERTREHPEGSRPRHTDGHPVNRPRPQPAKAAGKPKGDTASQQKGQ